MIVLGAILLILGLIFEAGILDDRPHSHSRGRSLGDPGHAGSSSRPSALLLLT